MLSVYKKEFKGEGLFGWNYKILISKTLCNMLRWDGATGYACFYLLLYFNKLDYLVAKFHYIIYTTF